MIHESDLIRLKNLNKVQRILQRKESFLNKDLVHSLIEKIRMLKKQKTFLQTKLREKYNDQRR